MVNDVSKSIKDEFFMSLCTKFDKVFNPTLLSKAELNYIKLDCWDKIFIFPIFALTEYYQNKIMDFEYYEKFIEWLMEYIKLEDKKGYGSMNITKIRIDYE